MSPSSIYYIFIAQTIICHDTIGLLMIDGNLKDVIMVSMALQKSNYKNALFITDKGFYSVENIKLLEQGNLEYLIPLKRNSRLI